MMVMVMVRVVMVVVVVGGGGNQSYRHGFYFTKENAVLLMRLLFGCIYMIAHVHVHCYS